MKNLRVSGSGGFHGTGRQHITVSNLNFHSKILKRHSLAKKKYLNLPLLSFREDSGESSVWKNQFFSPVHFQFIKQILSKAICKKEKNTKNWFLQFSFLGRKLDAHQGTPDIRGMILKNWDTARKMTLSTQNGINLRDSSGNKVLYSIMSQVAAANIPHRKTPGRNFLYRSVVVPETVASTSFYGDKSLKFINNAYVWKEFSEKSLRTLVLSKINIQYLNKLILKSIFVGNTLPYIDTIYGSILRGRTAAYKDSAILSPAYFPRLKVNFNSRLIAPPDPVFKPVTGFFPAKEVYPLLSGKELIFNTEDGVRQVNKAAPKDVSEKSLKTLALSKINIQALNKLILKSVVIGNMLPYIDTVYGSILRGRADAYKSSAILSPFYFPRLKTNLNSKFIAPSDPVFEPEPVIGRLPAKEVYSMVSGKELVFNTEDGVRQVNKSAPKGVSEKSLKRLALSREDIQALNKLILKSVVTGNKLPYINAVSRETFPVRSFVPGKFFSARNHVSGRILLDIPAVYKSSAILSPFYFPRLKTNFNSRFIVPSDPVFEPEPVIGRFPVKEVYSMVSGKNLVFNIGNGVRQELEKEVAAIKEKLFQAEKTSQASYSSIYLKMEEELKKKLEINRISEQVIQQIVRRLNIEKERRGFL